MATDPTAVPSNDDWLADYDRAEQLVVASEPPLQPRLRPPELVRELESVWISTAPPADDLQPASFAAHGREPVNVYCYTDKLGVPIGYVCRFEDPKTGKKDIRPWSYGKIQGDDADRWACQGFSRPRPLYGLGRLGAGAGKAIVVVEGEKCADVANHVLTGLVAVSWPGGANAVRHVDWTPLANHDEKLAYLWPDNDEPGEKAMLDVAGRLRGMGYAVFIINPPEDKPSGWDIADCVEEGLDALAFVNNAEEMAAPAAPAPPAVWIAPAPPPLDLPPPEEEDESNPGRWRIDTWQAIGLELASGKPMDNASNVCLVLAREYAGRIWFDQFSGRVMTRASDGAADREWCDADDINLLVDLQRRCGLVKARKGTVQDAVVRHAMLDERHQVRDWLKTLEWDQAPRINAFFGEVCGAMGPPSYNQAVSANFFISMVARAMKPGCKVDTMVVLEGAQGMRKSMLCAVLGGPWHTVMRSAPTSKDFEITLQGSWLVEVAEFDAFSRADVSATKRTLTTDTDRYRSPYGRHAQSHPRMSVFVATVNRQDYSTDDTGARRLWPVECSAIDIERARRDRDQLFAEALTRYRAGETWWQVPDDEAKVIQRERYADDTWSRQVLDWIGPRASVHAHDVLEHLGIETGRQTTGDARRVASIMRMAGWLQKVQGGKGSSVKTHRVWVNPESDVHRVRWATRVDVEEGGPPEDNPPPFELD